MNKKYIHFTLEPEKPEEKRIMEHIKKKWWNFSMKALFIELIKKDMEGK